MEQFGDRQDPSRRRVQTPAGPEHLDRGFVAGFGRKQGYPDPAEDVAVLGERGHRRRAL
jgi:hypothetical protein